MKNLNKQEDKMEQKLTNSFFKLLKEQKLWLISVILISVLLPAVVIEFVGVFLIPVIFTAIVLFTIQCFFAENKSLGYKKYVGILFIIVGALLLLGLCFSIFNLLLSLTYKKPIMSFIIYSLLFLVGTAAAYSVGIYLYGEKDKRRAVISALILFMIPILIFIFRFLILLFVDPVLTFISWFLIMGGLMK